MEALRIQSLSEETLEETALFIAQCQRREEAFVAWLGYSPDEIKQQLLNLTPNLSEAGVIALEQGAVCGFLGIYRSEEQKTLRLLGPYVASETSWKAIAVQLLSALNDKRPPQMTLAKVAFYEANQNCKALYEENCFEIYNAERTLVMDRLRVENPPILDAMTQESVHLRPYQPEDVKDFERIHPSGAYFTASEVVQQLDDHHQIIVAEQDQRVIGYVYYELLTSDGYAELCFLNVLPEFRGKGIGASLISRTITEAFKYSWIKEIQISVRVNNEGAERLYKRLGFIEKNVVIALQKSLTVNQGLI